MNSYWSNSLKSITLLVNFVLQVSKHCNLENGKKSLRLKCILGAEMRQKAQYFLRELGGLLGLSVKTLVCSMVKGFREIPRDRLTFRIT